MARSALVEFIIRNQQTLIQVDFSRELFMIPDRLFGKIDKDGTYIVKTNGVMYKGKLFVVDDEFLSVGSFERIDDRTTNEVVYRVTGYKTSIEYKDNGKALCTPQDRFTLNPGDIINYKQTKPIETTIGVFMANYLFFVYPFGDIIEYLNEEFNEDKLKKRIVPPLLENKITTRQAKDRYVNTLTLFGQSTDIICPNITEKTMSVPKEIHDLRERLVKENIEALKAGDASVMSDIENQLINAYKKYLENDPSLHYLLKKKYFNVTLKKLLLVQGITEKFGQPGSFTFIEQPMGHGWKVENLPDIFNEVRQGSYARAIETADGGVIAKLILRVLQDTIIGIPDCKTKRGEKVKGSKDVLRDFIYNYIIEEDGENTLITDDNYKSFEGRELIIRTPGYCQSTKGFCSRCFGYLFEVLGQKAFAPVANDFARNQTTSALKSMHGKSHAVVDVSNINKYLIG